MGLSNGEYKSDSLQILDRISEFLFKEYHSGCFDEKIEIPENILENLRCNMAFPINDDSNDNEIRKYLIQKNEILKLKNNLNIELIDTLVSCNKIFNINNKAAKIYNKRIIDNLNIEVSKALIKFLDMHHDNYIIKPISIRCLNFEETNTIKVFKKIYIFKDRLLDEYTKQYSNMNLKHL